MRCRSDGFLRLRYRNDLATHAKSGAGPESVPSTTEARTLRHHDSRLPPRHDDRARDVGTGTGRGDARVRSVPPPAGSPAAPSPPGPPTLLLHGPRAERLPTSRHMSVRFGDTPIGDLAVRFYSYIVARDFGFAPNPFFGYCTLATCKPRIRQYAKIGDRILGTGSKATQRHGHLVFAMRVDEVMSYDEYWNDPRFLVKRPNMRSSIRNGYGDNIYHKDGSGCWIQEDSHHSRPHGQPCDANSGHDTQTDRVLIGQHFCYWGGSGPPIPDKWRKEVCHSTQHYKMICARLAPEVAAWLDESEQGYCGEPLNWSVR